MGKEQQILFNILHPALNEIKVDIFVLTANLKMRVLQFNAGAIPYNFSSIASKAP
ncbi:MAG: hypothetical protein IPK03_04835 [Bacteroidetes bacterium]|nr:hypothetical protein [Bacteroidota bacterium]